MKVAQRVAQKSAAVPELWARCLLGHCYGLWFLCLPAYVRSAPSRVQALHTAYHVLRQMESHKVVLPDEVGARARPPGWGGGLAPPRGLRQGDSGRPGRAGPWGAGCRPQSRLVPPSIRGMSRDQRVAGVAGAVGGSEAALGAARGQRSPWELERLEEEQAEPGGDGPGASPSPRTSPGPGVLPGADAAVLALRAACAVCAGHAGDAAGGRCAQHHHLRLLQQGAELGPGGTVARARRVSGGWGWGLLSDARHCPLSSETGPIPSSRSWKHRQPCAPVLSQHLQCIRSHSTALVLMRPLPRRAGGSCWLPGTTDGVSRGAGVHHSPTRRKDIVPTFLLRR